MIPETFGKLHFVYENFSRYLDDVLFGCLVVLFGNLVFSNITTRIVFAHLFHMSGRTSSRCPNIFKTLLLDK